MPTFEFQGRDMAGNAIAGNRIARSAESISVQLIHDGITPIQIQLVKEKTNYWKTLNDWFQVGKVSTEEMGIFARQMHTLCKAGVPITNALKRLAETARSVRMTEALNGISETLESGMDLASAMQRYPKIFTPLMISMVKVGESSGKLDEIFLRLNEYIELEGTAMKRIAAAARYPLLIFSIMIVAIIVVNIFVIPT
ncbi:MAG TPA: type II secretion system F family protein, partial [Gammaproteobacteria bacterium]|nr:type II secretion system F family protein [Gammaproteobacteria bacterium]